jgi:hypothetical protein
MIEEWRSLVMQQPIGRDVLMIAVLAGSRRQFDDFVQERGIAPHEAVYVDEPQRAYGAHFSGIMLVGTWYMRDGAWALEALVRSRIRPT